MNNYVELLEKQLIKQILILVVISILFLLLSIIAFKILGIKKGSIVLILGLVIVSCIFIFCVFPYQKDISNADFISYEGTFYVEDAYSINGYEYILIKIGDSPTSKKYKVLCDISLINIQTEYTGKLTWGNNSQTLLFVNFIE